MNAHPTIRLAALALIACAGAPATPGPQAAPAGRTPADFFPLAVGNSWTYLDRSAPQQAPARHRVAIVQRDAEGYFVDDQRGALRADGDCLHDRVRRLLCAPLSKGQTWLSVIAPSVVERYEVVGVDEQVTVPAGTFKGCVRVRAQVRARGVDQVAEQTYAPGVGLVRLETFAVVNGEVKPQVSGALESYRLAEGK